MDYSLKVVGYDPESNIVKVKLDETLNLERLNTYYNSDLSNVVGNLNLSDPRAFSYKQRALYRALLNDIYDKYGNESNSTHEWFKEKYFSEFGKEISTKNGADTSVEEMNNLIELVIDFMLEWGVPFKKGYELLPRDESYFYYLCLKHRKCCICGKHADVHHIDVVGMGNNRKKIENRDRRLMALCRKCHTEIHYEGYAAFVKKHNVQAVKLNDATLKRLGLNIIERDLD